MRVIADTHVHLYDAYDIPAAFEAMFRNLRRLSPSGADTFLAACLTERADCQFFSALQNSELDCGQYRIAPSEEAGCLLVTEPEGETVYLFAGRQIVTRERLEVLGLFVTETVPDGLDAGEAIRRVRSLGGIPVLAWSPGKWFGARGATVNDLFKGSDNDSLAAGDTTMRPYGWPFPRLMQEAADLGHPVIAGSDPLPFPGQERLIGTFGTAWETDSFNPAQPVTELRTLICTGKGTSCGKRGSIASVAARWLTHKRS